MTGQTSIQQKGDESFDSIDPDRVSQFHDIINIQNLQQESRLEPAPKRDKKDESYDVLQQRDSKMQSKEHDSIEANVMPKTKAVAKTDRTRQT